MEIYSNNKISFGKAILILLFHIKEEISHFYHQREALFWGPLIILLSIIEKHHLE
jgi:hypothetical protein